MARASFLFRFMGWQIQAGMEAFLASCFLLCIPQKCRTDNTSVIAQLRDDDLRVLLRIACIHLACHDFLHRQQQRIALVADTAADAEDVRLEDIDRIRDTCC